MSVGSVLIQPQRLARAEASDDSDTALADAAKLAIGILRDSLGHGHIVEQFEAAGIAAMGRVVARGQAGADHARQRLGSVVETPIARLMALADELAGVDDADTALAAVHDVFTSLTAAAEELTIDQIREHVAELLDIVETDLRLTPDFLESEIWAFLDDVVERLEHIAPEPDPALRSNRIQVIGALRRLRRRVGDAFEFPELDAEHAADDLFAFIRGTGVPGAASSVACVGANLAQAAQTGRSLLQTVPFSGFLPGSVGSGVVPEPKHGDDEYLWYPSWLANNNRPPGFDVALIIPGDEVRINKGKTQIVQRNVWRNDQLIASGTNLSWKDHPRLGDSATPYAFKQVDADAMEKIAFATAIIQSGLEVLFHLISIEEGDHWSNIVNVLGGVTNIFWKGAAQEPMPWWLDGLIFRTLGTLGASFEGMHTKANAGNCFMMWLTLAGPDVAEMLTWKYITNLARDLLLSVLTLANNDPHTTGTHPRNREEFDAVRHAITLALHNLFLLAFKRKNWGVMIAESTGPSMSPLVELLLLWSLLGGIGVGLVGGFLGSLLGQGFARDADFSSIGKKMWWAIPQGVLLTPFWLYLQNEGSTRGGKYTPFTGNAYVGYQPKDTSPYKMPFDPAAVSTCYIGQANQGLWSHNFNNVGQVYAYDWSLDHGDEILAVRSGTVINFSETIPNTENPAWEDHVGKLATPIGNNTHPATIDVVDGSVFANLGWVVLGPSNGDIAYYTSKSGNTLQGVTWRGGNTTAAYAANDDVTQTIFGWNFIVVKHDLDETLTALTAPHAHDKGLGGAAITTLAVYGHGLPGSITAAFASHSPAVPVESIVGTPVKQGMPLMAAGDTGISFHNHLHMHIVKDPGTGTLPDYRAYGGDGETIPFVFSDEDVPGDGVLKHFDWYRSANAKVLS